MGYGRRARLGLIAGSSAVALLRPLRNLSHTIGAFGLLDSRDTREDLLLEIPSSIRFFRTSRNLMAISEYEHCSIALDVSALADGVGALGRATLEERP